MRRPVMGCAICDREIEPGATIRWRGRDFHVRCILAAVLLVGSPGSEERAEIAAVLVPA